MLRHINSTVLFNCIKISYIIFFQLKDKISIYKLSKLTMSNNISFVFLKSNFLLPNKT